MSVLVSRYHLVDESVPGLDILEVPVLKAVHKGCGIAGVEHAAEIGLESGSGPPAEVFHGKSGVVVEAYLAVLSCPEQVVCPEVHRRVSALLSVGKKGNVCTA